MPISIAQKHVKMNSLARICENYYNYGDCQSKSYTIIKTKDNKMKKLMILGAGYTQVPLHKAAQKLGYSTIAASIPGDYDSFNIADEIAYADISDPAAVIDAAKQFKADGVATCGLDLGMKAIGYVCEALALNGPSKSAAETVSDKYLMKKALKASGVTTADFFCIHNETELEEAIKRLTFPVILKATDQMGGRGIFKSSTPDEARENFKKSMAATKKDYCLIEKFIDGPLFGVEAMIQNGKIIFMLPNNTEIFEGATNIPIGHSVPFNTLDKHGDAIKREVSAAIKAVGLDNCPVNCDCILHGDEVYIVELTGRSGATGLSEMVSLKYGINYYEVIVRLAMGDDVRPFFTNESDSAILTHTMTAPREGILRNIKNNNPDCPNIRELSFNISKGDHVQPFTNGRDRIGQTIITANNLDECRHLLNDLESHITYELEGDLPIIETPIQPLKNFDFDNEIYIKREDLIPFAFGGNKVRFADAYLKDMEKKNCDAMITYGSYSSNLCRILSTACADRNIPCSMIYNIEDSDPDKKSTNADIIRHNNVKEYRCTKATIANAVEKAISDFKAAGYTPYYIHGNKFGQGNVSTPMASYVDCYFEILKQEKALGITFDYIFLASSTNTSQSGLIAGSMINGDSRKIIGVSVNRKRPRAEEVINSNLDEYKDVTGCRYKTNNPTIVEDSYICGGYGLSSPDICNLSRKIYETEHIELDTTYTGKAFYGMSEYLKKNNIRGKKILFMHTGGNVLFRDELGVCI